MGAKDVACRPGRRGQVSRRLLWRCVAECDEPGVQTPVERLTLCGGHNLRLRALGSIGAIPTARSPLALAGNDAVATASAESMIRGAALFGSNLENMNLLTGGTETVINSERQLWSVAGMLSLVQHTTLGIDAQPDGLHIAPFLPAQLRAHYLDNSNEITLGGLQYRGHRIDVTLELPAAAATAGAYRLTGMSLGGRDLASEVRRTAKRSTVRVPRAWIPSS